MWPRLNAPRCSHCRSAPGVPWSPVIVVTGLRLVHGPLGQRRFLRSTAAAVLPTSRRLVDSSRFYRTGSRLPLLSRRAHPGMLLLPASAIGWPSRFGPTAVAAADRSKRSACAHRLRCRFCCIRCRRRPASATSILWALVVPSGSVLSTQRSTCRHLVRRYVYVCTMCIVIYSILGVNSISLTENWKRFNPVN